MRLIFAILLNDPAVDRQSGHHNAPKKSSAAVFPMVGRGRSGAGELSILRREERGSRDGRSSIDGQVTGFTPQLETCDAQPR